MSQYLFYSTASINTSSSSSSSPLPSPSTAPTTTPIIILLLPSSLRLSLTPSRYPTTNRAHSSFARFFPYTLRTSPIGPSCSGPAPRKKHATVWYVGSEACGVKTHEGVGSESVAARDAARAAKLEF